MVSTTETRRPAANGRRKTAKHQEKTSKHIITFLLKLMIITIVMKGNIPTKRKMTSVTCIPGKMNLAKRIGYKAPEFQHANEKKILREDHTYVTLHNNVYAILKIKQILATKYKQGLPKNIRFKQDRLMAKKTQAVKGGKGKGNQTVRLPSKKSRKSSTTAKAIEDNDTTGSVLSQQTINFLPSNTTVKDSTGAMPFRASFEPDMTMTVLTPSKTVELPCMVTPDHEPPPKKVMNAPPLKSVNNEKATSHNEKNYTTYITRVQYRRQVTTSPNVIELMKTLTASMMQYNKTVQLLPFQDGNANNPLITPRDIPNEVDEFGIYVPYAKFTRRGWLFMRFKIQADMPLWKLKKNQRNYGSA